jgi:electron transfer flavoprotein beta subunit
LKILVPIKRVPDPEQKIKLSADGSSLETEGAAFVVNPFDAIALEEALRIRENSSDEVEILAVGIGGEECEEQLRTALAMGTDRALKLLTPSPPDPWNVSRILKILVLREQPELVMMGKQAVDDDSNQVGQFLAAQLDWPQVTFVSKLEFSDGKLVVDRETDAGIEQASVPLPAVVTTDLRLNEPRYVSLPGIVKARRKPLETLSLDELDMALEPRIEILKLEIPSSARELTRVEDAEDLLKHLKEAKVI